MIVFSQIYDPGITCAIHLHSGKKVASVAESSGLIRCVLFDGKWIGYKTV